jgi:hypothetical protein
MNRQQIARSKAQFPRCAYLIFLNEGSNIIVSALDQGTRPLRSLSEKPPPKLRIHVVGTGSASWQSFAT